MHDRGADSAVVEELPARVRWPARVAGAVRRFAAFVRRLGRVSVMTLVAWLMPPVGGLVILGTLPLVGPWLADQHAWGVAIYVSAFVVCAGLALLPTYAQAILGGWAFGFAVGFPAALVGFSGAAALSYAVTGRIAGNHMLEVIETNPKWKAIHTALVGSGAWRTLWLVILLRLPPVSPFAAVNVLLTSAGVARVPYMVGTAVGLAPRVGVAVFVAAGMSQLDLSDARSTAYMVTGIIVSIAVVIVIGQMARRAVRRMAEHRHPDQVEQADGPDST